MFVCVSLASDVFWRCAFLIFWWQASDFLNFELENFLQVPWPSGPTIVRSDGHRVDFSVAREFFFSFFLFYNFKFLIFNKFGFFFKSRGRRVERSFDWTATEV